MPLFSRSLELRWRQPGVELRPLAERIHEHVRAGVLAKVEAGEKVDFVSCGVATPPGPIRLILEDRRKGLPGRSLKATLRRERDELVLSLEERLLRPLPPELLETLHQAASAVAGPEACSAWRRA